MEHVISSESFEKMKAAVKKMSILWTDSLIEKRGYRKLRKVLLELYRN